MTATTFTIRVELDGGKEFTVTADQRDIAKFEQQPFGLPFYALDRRPFTFLRFAAWNAGRREKLHTMSWAEFEDAAVQVEDLDKTGLAGVTDPDPGMSAASAEN